VDDRVGDPLGRGSIKRSLTTWVSECTSISRASALRGGDVPLFASAPVLSPLLPSLSSAAPASKFSTRARSRAAARAQQTPVPTGAPDPAETAWLTAQWGTPAAGTSAPALAADGLATRITTVTAAHLLRTTWTLTAPYTLEATFTTGADAPPATAGLSAGGGALTCVVGADGAPRIAAGLLREAGPGGLASPASVHLVLRVTAAGATCTAQGRTTTYAGPVPAGSPGVYVGPGATVQVSGFTIDVAQTPPRTR